MDAKERNSRLNALDAQISTINAERVKLLAECDKEVHDRGIACWKTLRHVVNAHKHKHEFIDVIAPKHDCTSCSDVQVVNGYFNHDYARCVRCYLLQLLVVNEYAAEPIKINISIQQLEEE